MISVIMPAYNEEEIIEEAIVRTATILESLNSSWEIVVIDDGSTDSTFERANRLKKVYKNKLKVFTYNKNRGKGFALKYGFEHSVGDPIVFLDSDLDIDPSAIEHFINILNNDGVDVVVGSKRHPMSNVEYPLKRRVLSDAYFLMTKIMFNLNVKDTQVGLKAFRRRVLEDVMPRILVKRYAFDVELLANAVRRGYKVVEAPVNLNFKFNSHINWMEIYRMFLDTLAVAYRMYIRRYYD